MVLKLSPADGAAFDFHECLVDEGEAFEANTQPLEVVQPRDYRLLADDSRSWNDRCYSYDAADNRTGAFSRQAKQTIVANALNQMQTVNGQPAQYDAAGNDSKPWKILPSISTQYTVNQRKHHQTKKNQAKQMSLSHFYFSQPQFPGLPGKVLVKPISSVYALSSQ